MDEVGRRQRAVGELPRRAGERAGDLLEVDRQQGVGDAERAVRSSTMNAWASSSAGAAVDRRADRRGVDDPVLERGSAGRGTGSRAAERRAASRRRPAPASSRRSWRELGDRLGDEVPVRARHRLGGQVRSAALLMLRPSESERVEVLAGAEAERGGLVGQLDRAVDRKPDRGVERARSRSLRTSGSTTTRRARRVVEAELHHRARMTADVKPWAGGPWRATSTCMPRSPGRTSCTAGQRAWAGS